MRAIVILYEGTEVPVQMSADIISAMVSCIQHDSHPAIAKFDDKEVAQLITSGALKGQASIVKVEKEESPENAAAIYLAKTFKKSLTSTSSTYELTSAVMSVIAKSPMKEELSNALFIISQSGAIEKVDNTICMRHHISKEQLAVISKTYRFSCMIHG